MRERASAGSPSLGSPKKKSRSPKKKSRSPKKATFNFNLKNILRLNRPDCAKRLCDGDSPIHTLKYTGRSLSDPMLNVKRKHDFDSDNEEKDNASNDGEERESDTASALAPLRENRSPEENNRNVFTDGLQNELSRQPVCDVRGAGEQQFPGYADDVSKGSSVGEEIQDVDAVMPTHRMSKFDDEEEEKSGATDPEGGGNCTDTREDESVLAVRALTLVASECDNEQEQQVRSSEILAHQLTIQAPDDAGELSQVCPDDFSVPARESESEATVVSGESCPMGESLNCATQLDKISAENSEFVLGLFSIDEEECEDEDVVVDGQEVLRRTSQLVNFNRDFHKELPATTTHRIRVGILPGSPIHTPRRLACIFEDDEMKIDDGSDDGSVSDRETLQPRDLYLEVFQVGSTDSTMLAVDDFHTDGDEVPIFSPHGAECEVLSEGPSNPQPAPLFTPTSPVEVRETQDAGAWLMSQSADLLDYFEDGDSTWTNWSSNEGDSGMELQFGISSIDPDEEDGGHEGALFAGEDIVVELEEAEVRLDAAIAVVSEAIDLASDILGLVSDVGIGVDVDEALVEGVQVGSNVLRGDGTIGLSFERESNASDTSEMDMAHLRIDALDVESLNSSGAEQAEHELEDGVDAPASCISPPHLATHSEGNDVDSGIVHDTADVPYPSLEANGEFAAADVPVQDDVTEPSHRSPFAQIYGGNISRGGHTISMAAYKNLSEERDPSSKVSGDFDACIHGHELTDICDCLSCAKKTASEIATSLATRTPKPEECAHQGSEITPGFVLLGLWALAAAGAALFGPSLLQLQASHLQRLEMFPEFTPSSMCHRVWHALADVDHDNAVSPLLDTTARIMTVHEVEQTRLGLLESDIIDACKLVVEMHSKEELAAADCLLEALEDGDEERCDGADFESQWGDADTTKDLKVDHYLLGLAFTLLVVAFLQYDRRA